MGSKRLWTGLYPAVTTQFTATLALDLDASRKRVKALIKAGVHGLVVLGPYGETDALQPLEKRAVLDVATEAADGRLPIVAGVCEPTTERATEFARDAQAIGADALILLPPSAYRANEEELLQNVLEIAAATFLPIMLCSSPTACHAELSLVFLERLAAIPNIVAIYGNAPDPRRFTSVADTFGDRYALMTGLDQVTLDGFAYGAKGWVSGIASAFPKEAVALVQEYSAGRLDQARRIYRWLKPLLHLDAEHDVVQSIKLAEQMVGYSSEHVRLPHLPLSGARRSEVIAIVENAITTRPEKGCLAQPNASVFDMHQTPAGAELVEITPLLGR